MPSAKTRKSNLVDNLVVSLAVQALIERLMTSGVLSPVDIVHLREVCLECADTLKLNVIRRDDFDGDDLEQEIRMWWDPLGVPATQERLSSESYDKGQRLLSDLDYATKSP